MTNYQNAKKMLKERADFIKKENPKDKPLQREVINNHLDWLCRNYNFDSHKSNLLANYACKLHPKD